MAIDNTALQEFITRAATEESLAPSSRKPIFGIPDVFFSTVADGSLTDKVNSTTDIGKSGRELVCVKSKDAIKIYDKEYGAGFDAPFVKAQCLKGVLSASINIYNKQREKHPDFEPRESVLRCFNYLQAQGNEIRAFESAWALNTRNPKWDSTNAQYFVRNLEKLGISLEDEATIYPDDPRWKSLCDSICATWTGNLMDVIQWIPQKIEITKRAVYVLFLAPNNQMTIPIDLTNPEIYRKIPTN